MYNIIFELYYGAFLSIGKFLLQHGGFYLPFSIFAAPYSVSVVHENAAPFLLILQPASFSLPHYNLHSNILPCTSFSLHRMVAPYGIRFDRRKAFLSTVHHFF